MGEPESAVDVARATGEVSLVMGKRCGLVAGQNGKLAPQHAEPGMIAVLLGERTNRRRRGVELSRPHQQRGLLDQQIGLSRHHRQALRQDGQSLAMTIELPEAASKADATAGIERPLVQHLRVNRSRHSEVSARRSQFALQPAEPGMTRMLPRQRVHCHRGGVEPA